jgi:hypothetical protein
MTVELDRVKEERDALMGQVRVPTCAPRTRAQGVCSCACARALV